MSVTTHSPTRVYTARRVTAPSMSRPSSAGSQCTAAIVIFVGINLLAFAAMPSSVRYIYPAFAFLTAIFLFVRSREHYIGFVFWLWFISPFVRRIVDYRSGFVPTSPLLLASFLATAVSGYVMLKHFRALSLRSALPFSCTLAAIGFGTVVGLTRYPVSAVAQALLNWVVPILFGFFLYAERERFAEYRVVVERSFLYGMLLVGAYGIFQFFFLPVWDKQWMLDLDARTFGVPEALQIRVFSTLNAPATCAAYLMAGLLMLFALKGKARLIAAPLAFLSFVLTSSRSSWIGLVFGILYLTLQMPNKARIRVVAGLLICIALTVVASQLPVLDVVISTRLQSFTDPKKDVSYNERVGGHVIAFQKLLSEPMGEGMGSVDTDHTTTGGDASVGPHDSTILESLYALGLPGSLLYLIGICSGAVIIMRPRQGDSNLFSISIKAVLIGFASQFYLNSIFVGAFGFVVWTAIGMSLAASNNRSRPLSLETRSFG